MEEDFLSLDNIVSDPVDETLFETPDELDTGDGEKTDDQDEKNTVTEANPEDLFDDEPESVGNEEDNWGQENPDTEEPGGSSAKFYSSIARALKNDGILGTPDDDAIKNVKTADDFREMFENEVNSRLSDIEKRVNEVLDYGVEPSEVAKYENTIKYLDSITEDSLSQETDEAELERKRLIYQDYVNRGFSQEKAMKEVQKSINAGTDIEDAIDALESNKKFFSDGYNAVINKAKEKEEAVKKQMEKNEAELVKMVEDTTEPFAGIKIDKQTRERILENISKPSVKRDDGKYYTKLQDYQLENPNEFLHKLGVLFTLTDGFKNIDKLVGKKVKTETSKNIRGLEQTLKNQRNYGGNPRYVGNGVNDDDSPNQHFSRFSLNT